MRSGVRGEATPRRVAVEASGGVLVEGFWEGSAAGSKEKTGDQEIRRRWVLGGGDVGRNMGDRG